jgi:hypothetical protein
MRTKQAAQYLRDRGLQISVSKLQKLRCRGSADHRDRGPDFRRDTVTGFCYYAAAALDAYVERRLGPEQFRAPAPQPEQFKPRVIRRAAAPKRACRRRAEL